METKIKSKNICITILKWLGLILLLGLLSGILGATFAKAIAFVTNIRMQNGWLILLLPIGGLASVFVFKTLEVNAMGTNQVLKSAEGENCLSPLLAPAIFLGSVISHLLGASVGREGAALQLGGSIATYLSKIFKLDEEGRKILVYCGMAGLFSAVFGTPIAAFLFAIEVVYVGKIKLKAILPAFLTSFVAFFVSKGLKTHPERFNLKTVPAFSLLVLFKTAMLIILAGVIGIVFCYALRYLEKYLKKIIKSDYLRIVLGSVVIVALTAIIGNQTYNGAGVNFIESIFEIEIVINEAFVLKMLFTVIAVSAGFKGGEIVPTLFIGAAFGSAAAVLFGLPVSFGAAIGMTALFCSVTNCPLATIFLGLEMFSFKGAGYLILAAVLSFAVSGKIGLYSAQKRITFKKGVNNEK